MTQIERDFGQGALMRLGADSTVQIEAIPTGALALDLALGIGGVPRGRIVEIFGPESSGKTTLIYHIIAEAQARGGDLRLHRHRARDRPDLRAGDRRRHRRAARLPARLRRAGAADRRPADRLGGDRRGRDRLGRGADAESRARRPDRRPDGRPPGPPDVAGDAQTGRQPQPHQHRLPLHQPDPRKDRRPVRLAGDPAGRPGAEVLLPRSGSTSAASRPSRRGPRRSATGSGSRSSRTRWPRPSARPSSTSSTASGISREGGLLDFGIEHDLVQKSGSFFSYGETRLGQGRNNAKQFLADNPEIASEIEAKIRTALGLGADAPAPRRGRGAEPVAAAEAAKRPESRAQRIGFRRAAWTTATSSTSSAIALAVSAVMVSLVRPEAREVPGAGLRRWSSLWFIDPDRRRDDLRRPPRQGRGEVEGRRAAAGGQGNRTGGERRSARRTEPTQSGGQAPAQEKSAGEGQRPRRDAEARREPHRARLRHDRSLSSKPGKVTIDFTNPSTLEHNVAIEQNGKQIADLETDRRAARPRSAPISPPAPTPSSAPCRATPKPAWKAPSPSNSRPASRYTS